MLRKNIVGETPHSNAKGKHLKSTIIQLELYQMPKNLFLQGQDVYQAIETLLTIN